MSLPLQCSAVLCVLDEIENISKSLDNLRNLNLDQVLVVDGGSTDGTLEHLSNANDIELLALPGQGLLRQRLEGIRRARNGLILLVDVDDRIRLAGFTEMLDSLARRESLDGLQLMLESRNRNFWERGWSAYFKVLTPKGKSLKLLGRPSIVRRSIYLAFDNPPEGVFGEDTWIHLQERKEKRTYEVGGGSSIRECPNTWASNLQQFKRYGETDSILAGSIAQHFNLLFHAAIRIGLARSLKALFSGRLEGFLFTMMLGFTRAAHHSKHWILNP